jgi:SH3 domain-containing YSC84-like protein 1
MVTRSTKRNFVSAFVSLKNVHSNQFIGTHVRDRRFVCGGGSGRTLVMHITSLKHTLLNHVSLPLACFLVVGLASGPALAQQSSTPQTMKQTQRGQLINAQKLVNESANVVRIMKSDPHLDGLLKEAKGVFIVPKYGRGALVVGGRGGSGLVVVNQNGTWSDPAFYDYGAISIGAQAGGSGGAVAFLLMNQRAVNAFKNGNKFALNAGAGLTIVNYSANSRASTGGDVIAWSDVSGAYIGATLSVSEIRWDSANNEAFYGRNVNATELLNGSVVNAKADDLRDALPKLS